MSKDSGEIREEIVQSSEEVSQAADALADEADVPTRSQMKLNEKKADLNRKKDQLLARVRDGTPKNREQARDQLAAAAKRVAVFTKDKPGLAGGTAAGRPTGRVGHHLGGKESPPAIRANIDRPAVARPPRGEPGRKAAYQQTPRFAGAAADRPGKSQEPGAGGPGRRRPGLDPGRGAPPTAAVPLTAIEGAAQRHRGRLGGG